MRFVFVVLGWAAVTAFAGKVAADPIAIHEVAFGSVL